MLNGSSVRSVLGAGLLLAPVLAQAAAFSFGDDWSISANPQNGYSYGHAANTTDPLTLFDQGFESQANVEQWRTLGVLFPLIAKNTSGSDIGSGTTVVIPAAPSRYLLTHPSDIGRYSVISYALPLTGTLAFNAEFASQDTAGATTDVHVFLSGTELFSGNISGIGSTLSYATPGGGLAVTVGDTLEVRVGFGANGNYFNDSTGVNVEGSITAVPEPSDYAAFAGLALVAFGAWRRYQR